MLQGLHWCFQKSMAFCCCMNRTVTKVIICNQTKHKSYLIIRGMKRLVPLINNFRSFEKSSTRPNTGLMPQICRTQSSKCKAISIICSNRQQTPLISEWTRSDLLASHSSVTIAMAWSCIEHVQKEWSPGYFMILILYIFCQEKVC